MTKKDVFSTYHEAAKKYAKSWNVGNKHVIDLMASVMMTRDNVLQGGSFAQAVVRNDLADAVNRADAMALQNIKVIVAAKNNCYVRHQTSQA